MRRIQKEFIFIENTPQCHASTLVQQGNVTIAAWFGGTREKHDDVQIYVSRRVAGTWSKPICVSTIEEIAHWNPVLFDNGNELLLFYKRGKTIQHWQTMLCRSTDGGVTWTEPMLLCVDDDGGRGPVKNKPLRLRDGSILAGASMEQGPWRAFTDRSVDNGYTWEKSDWIPLPDGVEVIQPTIWQDDDGVHVLLRSRNGEDERRVYRSDSPDGIHWSMAYPLSIPHNNSGLDLTQTPHGIVLCCNPVTHGRTPLCLLTSHDGIDFTNVCTLEDEPGEYSYPAVIWDGEKLRGTYTWRRERIVYFEAEL